MKKPDPKEYVKKQQEMASIRERECAEIVLLHRKQMLAVKKNAGVKATYNAYQALLPYNLRQAVPIMVIAGYTTFSLIHPPYWIIQEAKRIIDVHEKVDTMSKEVQHAREQYLLMVGLTA